MRKNKSLSFTKQLLDEDKFIIVRGDTSNINLRVNTVTSIQITPEPGTTFRYLGLVGQNQEAADNFRNFFIAVDESGNSQIIETKDFDPFEFSQWKTPSFHVAGFGIAALSLIHVGLIGSAANSFTIWGYNTNTINISHTHNNWT